MNKIFFCLLSAVALSGCCSYVNLDRDVPKDALVPGGKPIASFYVQNTSYQILGFIPWCTGDNFVDQSDSWDDANNWRMSWFCDNVSLDNNIRTLKRACKEVGSNRISSISHVINEDNLWSFLLVYRRTVKTTCFILEPKDQPAKPEAPAAVTAAK